MKQHYFMISGNVLFRGEEEGSVASINVNCMTQEKSRNFGVKQIAKIQQTLVAQAGNVTGSPVDPVGVTILNIMHLGHMTDKEFQNLELPIQDGVDLSTVTTEKLSVN